MNESITKEDLRQFGLHLMDSLRKVIQKEVPKDDNDPEWVKGRVVRKMMDMSAGTLQNLRVTAKVRYKKILGSYYYNKFDLQKLFKDEHQPGNRR